MHETVRVQVCELVALLLDVQVDEFHPGVVVVQLRPQIRGAAQDGCQLSQLPFLLDKGNSIYTLERPDAAGDLLWQLQEAFKFMTTWVLYSKLWQSIILVI